MHTETDGNRWLIVNASMGIPAILVAAIEGASGVWWTWAMCACAGALWWFVSIEAQRPRAARRTAQGFATLQDVAALHTRPAHVHDRRMKACLSFGMSAKARVLRLMGEPKETRNPFIASEEGAFSPPRSVHAGAGIGASPVIWAMAGDNVEHADMDKLHATEAF